MKKTLKTLTLLTLVTAGCHGSNNAQKVVDPNTLAQQGYGVAPSIGAQSLNYSGNYPYSGRSNLMSMNQCIQQCYASEDPSQRGLCPDACKNAYYGSVVGIPLNAQGYPSINMHDPYGYNGRMSQWYSAGAGGFKPVMNGNSYMMPYRSNSFSQDPRMTAVCPQSQCPDAVNSAYFYSMGDRVAAVDQYVYSLENNVPYTGPDFVAEDAAYQDYGMPTGDQWLQMGKGLVRGVVSTAANFAYNMAGGIVYGVTNGLSQSMQGMNRMSIRQFSLPQARNYGHALHQARFVNPPVACEDPNYQYSFACPQ